MQYNLRMQINIKIQQFSDNLGSFYIFPIFICLRKFSDNRCILPNADTSHFLDQTIYLPRYQNFKPWSLKLYFLTLSAQIKNDIFKKLLKEELKFPSVVIKYMCNRERRIQDEEGWKKHWNNLVRHAVTK